MAHEDMKGRVAENNNCTNNAEMYATIIQKSMENESIAFGNWLQHNNLDWRVNNWYNTGNNAEYVTSELYKIFQKENQIT